MTQNLLREELFTTKMLEWVPKAHREMLSGIPSHSKCAVALRGPVESTRLFQLKSVIRDCNADIATIDAVVRGLVEKKQVLQDFSNTYKPYLAAHRRLPQEILREIFTHCMKPSNSSRSMFWNMRTALHVSWVSASCTS